MNTVTYTLENGTKIVQPINKECFVNHKGNPVSEATLHQLFSDTAWDKRAVKYTIDSETNELKFKLTINENQYHPDSPLHAGTVTFKERIVIEPGVEYIFGLWKSSQREPLFNDDTIRKFGIYGTNQED